MGHIGGTQNKRSMFNKTLGQVKNEANEANLSNHMFFDHRKHRRIGQEVVHDKLTTNDSNSSLFDRLSRFNRLSSVPSKGLVHQMAKKKVLAPKDKESMKCAFHVLKS
jgi:hypothetical protein